MARPTPAGASDDEAIPRRRRHFSPGPPPTLLARPQRQPPPSLNQVAEQIQDAQLHRDVFPVDRWLGRCLDEALVPRKKHVDYFRAPTFDDFLTPDLVECTVTIAERECIEDDDGIFVNESIFRLNLNVYVPPECGFLCFVAHSPTVTLDKWRGLLDDTNNRPGWLDYHATGTLKFWQPRSVIVDLIGMFRCHSFNASNNPSLQRWVEGVTRGSWADMHAAMVLGWGPRETRATIPSNARGRKPRASSMTEEEALRLRASLRDDSVSPRGDGFIILP